jgi:predicted nucleic acid-binding Zn ribbon protein
LQSCSLLTDTALDMIGAAVEKKLCIACGREIPVSARLCSECSSFQAGWKNTVLFLANVVGIASVVIAVITYVVSTFPQLRRIVAWRESIKVLTFNERTYTFANEGDGELFLSHVSIRHRFKPDSSFGTLHQPIDKVIMPGSILSGEIQPASPELKWGELISHVSDQKWIELYDSSVIVGMEGCIYKLFLARNDPSFKMLSSFLGDNLRTFVVEAELHYYSLHKRSMQFKTFDAVGILHRSTNPNCAPME